jgi:hypothetical protein
MIGRNHIKLLKSDDILINLKFSLEDSQFLATAIPAYNYQRESPVFAATPPHAVFHLLRAKNDRCVTYFAPEPEDYHEKKLSTRSPI